MKLSRAVNTEMKLKRMSYSDGICTVCKSGNENIEHLLVDCKHVEDVWSFVESCFTQYNPDFNTLTRFMKIVGILSKGPLVEEMNMILGLVRWEIWKYRCKIKYDNLSSGQCSLVRSVSLRIKDHVFILLQGLRTIHYENIKRLQEILIAHQA